MISQQVIAVQEYCAKNLSLVRYQHLERVHATMQHINTLHNLNIDEEPLALASFGHDIARELPEPILALLLQQSGIPLEPWEEQYKLLCHTRIGSLLLQKFFGIINKEVLQAIECHTLGSKGLSLLAKLLYISDFLEPQRPYLMHGERENYLSMEFDLAVYTVCYQRACFNRDRGKPVFPPTLAMLEEYEQQLAIPPSQHFVLHNE